VAGLRLSDVEERHQGHIRARYSEDGPLKEDKGDAAPVVKWPPCPVEAQLPLSSWVGPDPIS
jgi:hypothetical protein